MQQQLQNQTIKAAPPIAIGEDYIEQVPLVPPLFLVTPSVTTPKPNLLQTIPYRSLV